MKKHITDIVSAGFASGASYGDMANQITGKMIGNYATMRGGALGRAKLIVRTEGNRIANAARLEAARTAKQQGADLVKQWDSTMDKKTRPHHVQLDGQVRELDEPFEVDGRKAQAPGKFGIASEDINCRCHAYSRPRWAVRADSDYKYDNQHRALVKVSSESYAAYRAGYVQETAGKPDGTVSAPAGYAVEVTPPATKDNGGTGKTYRAEKIGGKALTSGADSGIIKKISGALNPNSERADKHAQRYYAAVRKMKTDVSKIAQNTGFSSELVQSIKDFIFMEKHDLGDRTDYFDPDYKMAESWQRLADGKDIKPHDLTLLKHEQMERDLMKQGYSQAEAHKITSKTYNYAKEAYEYYDSVEKHKGES